MKKMNRTEIMLKPLAKKKQQIRKTTVLLMTAFAE